MSRPGGDHPEEHRTGREQVLLTADLVQDQATGLDDHQVRDQHRGEQRIRRAAGSPARSRRVEEALIDRPYPRHDPAAGNRVRSTWPRPLSINQSAYGQFRTVAASANRSSAAWNRARARTLGGAARPRALERLGRSRPTRRFRVHGRVAGWTYRSHRRRCRQLRSCLPPCATSAPIQMWVSRVQSGSVAGPPSSEVAAGRRRSTCGSPGCGGV